MVAVGRVRGTLRRTLRTPHLHLTWCPEVQVSGQEKPVGRTVTFFCPGVQESSLKTETFLCRFPSPFPPSRLRPGGSVHVPSSEPRVEETPF